MDAGSGAKHETESGMQNKIVASSIKLWAKEVGILSDNLAEEKKRAAMIQSENEELIRSNEYLAQSVQKAMIEAEAHDAERAAAHEMEMAAAHEMEMAAAHEAEVAAANASWIGWSPLSTAFASRPEQPQQQPVKEGTHTQPADQETRPRDSTSNGSQSLPGSFGSRGEHQVSVSQVELLEVEEVPRTLHRKLKSGRGASELSRNKEAAWWKQPPQ